MKRGLSEKCLPLIHFLIPGTDRKALHNQPQDNAYIVS